MTDPIRGSAPRLGVETLPQLQSHPGLPLWALVAVLGILLAAWNATTSGGLELDDLSIWLGASVPLVVASLSQRAVLAVGGQGLAAGSVAVLVNALIASQGDGDETIVIIALLGGPLLGTAIGAVNGWLIAYAKLPSTAVTLATGFIAQGLALIAITGSPNQVAPELSSLLLAANFGLGFASISMLAAGAVIAAAVLLQARVKRRAAEPCAARERALAYTLAGGGYGLTGVLLAGQLGVADPWSGAPFLLQIYAAAILGGAVAGLYGRSVWGPLLASLILTATVNLMIPLRIPAWTGPGLDALWLLAGCIAWRLGTSNPKQARTGDGSIRGARSWAFALTAAGALGVVALDPGLSSVGETLIYALVLSLLALGQSACIRARGFDLSMPSMTAAAGFIGMTLLQGADAALLRVTLIIAGLGIAAGLSNAVAIASGVPAVFATLATAGVLQVASGGVAVTSPMGFAPASLTWAMTGRLAGLPPALFLLVPCVAALTFALNRFLERPRSKPIGPTIVLYVASGVLSAASGLLLAGYGGGVTRPYQIEVYFLPTMAALTIAGIMIGGAQRSLSAVPPAVFCIVVFDTFLVRLGLDYGSRIVVLGGLLLGGTLVLRSIEAMRLASDERGV